MRDEGETVRERAAAGAWQVGRMARPDGVSLRIGHWPDPPGPRGTMLVLTGRCESLEKYTEVAGELHERRFRVAALDWRGQGGSSRLLPNPHKGHVTAFDHYLDDLDAALPALLEGAGDGPVVGFGHSMGGHILLRHVVERPHPFRAAILSAAMLGINTRPTPEVLVRRVAMEAVKRGHGEDYAFGQGDWSPAEPTFKANMLTGDPKRFLMGHGHYVSNPELALGGVTWGWLHEAFKSMERLFAQDDLGAVTLPVLVLSALKDRVVRADRHRQAAALLPNGVLKTYPKAKHELMMETDDIRHDVWADIDTFLDQVL